LRVYEQPDKINDIMNNRIENHPGLSDLNGYCYNSIETLEKWSLIMKTQESVCLEKLTSDLRK